MGAAVGRLAEIDLLVAVFQGGYSAAGGVLVVKNAEHRRTAAGHLGHDGPMLPQRLADSGRLHRTGAVLQRVAARGADPGQIAVADGLGSCASQSGWTGLPIVSYRANASGVETPTLGIATTNRQSGRAAGPSSGRPRRARGRCHPAVQTARPRRCPHRWHTVRSWTGAHRTAHSGRRARRRRRHCPPAMPARTGTRL